jgi:IMP dehydrogenase
MVQQFSNFSDGLTYDDVSLEPNRVDFTRGDIDLSTQLTRNVRLDIPIVSAPMDTVTGHALAIELGKLGGMGFIHRNQSVADQAAEVAATVKAGVRVGAAVGTYETDVERADSLVEAGVTILMIDSAHGHSKFVIDMIAKLKQRHPKVDVIAGNIATSQGAWDLDEAGADGLRVGMGPGAICTTRIISGMGVPQVSALLNVNTEASKTSLPFIADGGINRSGDLTKAIGAGASTIMLGRLLAGTAESIGETVELPADKVPNRFKSILKPNVKTYKFKTYRGMGSLGAMQAGKKLKVGGEFHDKDLKTDKLVAEGVEGLIPLSGSLSDLIATMLEGLKSGMYYTGNRTIADLQQSAKFYINTHASIMESHPHDMLVSNDGGNYTL